MNLGWKLLIPTSLGWFMLLAAQNVGQDRGWNTGVVTAVSIAVILICVMIVQAALKVSAANREREGSVF
jgi:NADH-quinone oxidoreductase subunit H